MICSERSAVKRLRFFVLHTMQVNIRKEDGVRGYRRILKEICPEVKVTFQNNRKRKILGYNRQKFLYSMENKFNYKKGKEIK